MKKVFETVLIVIGVFGSANVFALGPDREQKAIADYLSCATRIIMEKRDGLDGLQKSISIMRRAGKMLDDQKDEAFLASRLAYHCNRTADEMSAEMTVRYNDYLVAIEDMFSREEISLREYGFLRSLLTDRNYLDCKSLGAGAGIAVVIGARVELAAVDCRTMDGQKYVGVSAMFSANLGLVADAEVTGNEETLDKKSEQYNPMIMRIRDENLTHVTLALGASVNMEVTFSSGAHIEGIGAGLGASISGGKIDYFLIRAGLDRARLLEKFNTGY